MKQDLPPRDNCGVCAELNRLNSRCGQLTTGSIGKSELGLPLYCARLGSGARRVLISAGHHGNEWLGVMVVMAFISQLCAGAVCGVASEIFFKNTTLYFVPLVNPDGTALAQGTLACGTAFENARLIAGDFPELPFPGGWKANALGVDLNLQYPAGWEQARKIKFSQGFDRPAPRDFVGNAPLEAAESRALFEYTKCILPDTVVALHSQGEVIYWQYGGIRPRGAQALGERMSAVSGYALEDTPFESAHAGYKDWFIAEFDRPGYTVELGLGENPLPESQFFQIYEKAAPMLLQAALWNDAL